MKTTKSILAFFLAAIMLFGVLPLTAFAELPLITDIKWNDDYSVDFHIDGADKYRYSIYINNEMIWGFGTTSSESVSREQMLPYMTSLANDAINRYGYTGEVSFDFVIFAKTASDEYISSKTVVSKILNIEDVAAGKLSPDEEKWQIEVRKKDKYDDAFHAAYDPMKEEIESSIASTGISYDQYITEVIANAKKEESYTFTGTLGQTMRFSAAISEYGYTDVVLAKVINSDKIKNVNVTVAVPSSGQSLADYRNKDLLLNGTDHVKVQYGENNDSLYETNTKTHQSKFYGGNTYIIPLCIIADEGYEFDENVIVTVNGELVSLTGIKSADYYYCCINATVKGNFFSNIVTFFHNFITKIKYPNGMPF